MIEAVETIEAIEEIGRTIEEIGRIERRQGVLNPAILCLFF